MLEIRNVTKIYRSKAGNEVKALDNVSITFPETGMVFILGKSGSGKSTLLNVIGGLDGCDDGEFLIKGKSSRDFAGSDFDAYRNTFIGFIFQEYNILDDFTVGANIGLALELQGKKTTNEKINEILTEVELSDYAKRKPNELSGGQKQRIAIARALVKDPEIIMADEPTGALDSNTGKQIFDTLKELSRKKLVIIVSHDRDFAERYADRIIEMKDGRIESDVTKHAVEAKALSDGIVRMNDNLLKIEKGYQLTAKDVELINEYLRTREADILVSGDKRLNDNVRAVAGISADNRSSVFNNTDPATDVKVKTYDGKQTKFIRSSLPMKNAVKMSTSSLGHKKFRLVLTIFLSLIAFALFGFADTLGAYDKITTGTTSMVDSNIKNASFQLGVKYSYYYGGELQGTGYDESMFNDNDISVLNKKLGMNFIPVFNGSQSVDRTISLMNHMVSTSDIGSQCAYTGNLHGFVTMTKAQLDELGYTVYGTLPENPGEIAISKFIYEQLNFTGFRSTVNGSSVSIEAGSLTYTNPTDTNSIIGKNLQLNVGHLSKEFKITAVIDTMFEYDRYRDYIPTKDTDNNSPIDDSNALIDMIMLKELDTTLHYGFHCLGYVIGSDITEMSQNMEKWSNDSFIGESLQVNASLQNPNMTSFDGIPNKFNVSRLGTSADIPSLGAITWIDGIPRTTLAANEMLVESKFLNEIMRNESSNIYPQLYAKVAELVGPYDIDEYRDPFEYLRNYCYNSNGSDAQQLLVGYIKTILKDVLNINTDEFPNVPDEVYLGDITNSFYVENDGESGDYMCICRVDSIIDILTRLYAANVIYTPGSTIHNDSAFINFVIKNYDNVENYDNITDENEKLNRAYNAYKWYLSDQSAADRGLGTYGDVDYSYFSSKAMDIYFEISGSSLSQLLEGTYLSIIDWSDGNESETRYTQYKIVGLFVNPTNNNWGGESLIVCDTFATEYEKYKANIWYQVSAKHETGIYAFAIAPMPTDTNIIRKMVELSYSDEDIRFSLKNQVMDTLDNFNSFIEVGAKVFIYVGLGFAVFAALMMMNFISTSISYKRREIGILRAVGARSSDVFKIFFSEALIIALINYLLSIIATVTAVTVFNVVVRNQGINVTLLNFGVRQVLLMLLISVFVALLSSFLPVWNIARRKPVDAIKNK